MDRVFWESRHKFVYYDNDSIIRLRMIMDESPVIIDCDAPIPVYILDEGLPKMENKLGLDKDMVKIFHERYYGLLIFLSIIDTITNNIDNDELNKRLGRLFKLCSCIGTKKDINDIRMLRTLLIDSKNMYKDAYIEYMHTGKMDFYDKVPIPFIMMDNLLETLKKAIGLKKYFSVMIDLSGDISLYSSMAINNYIASRCNGYLSINVLLSDDNSWKSYYAMNGQFIQDVHDYTELDFRTTKKRERIRQN